VLDTGPFETRFSHPDATLRFAIAQNHTIEVMVDDR